MNICNYITNYLIKKNIILNDDKEVYAYGLFVILYNSFLVLNAKFTIIRIGNRNSIPIIVASVWSNTPCIPNFFFVIAVPPSS